MPAVRQRLPCPSAPKTANAAAGASISPSPLPTTTPAGRSTGAWRRRIFGAGHIGRALADTMTLLPLNVFVVEARQSELDQLSSEVHHRLAVLPETLIADIPPGSAVVIVTHDHALDFLIGQAALERSDLAYTGMVGSKSKRSSFLHHLEAQGVDRSEADRLVLPIGGMAVGDKRPEVIAVEKTEIAFHMGGKLARVEPRAAFGFAPDKGAGELMPKARLARWCIAQRGLIGDASHGKTS
jgi:xanthine/CO dehydrogenase XdhC/CoxF family maturation factor